MARTFNENARKQIHKEYMENKNNGTVHRITTQSTSTP